MKKVYRISIILASLLYGCGISGEVGDNTRVMSSIGNSSYTTTRGRVDQIELHSVSNLTTEGTAVDIALSKDGNTAYIASGEGGLEIIDISNPDHPRYIKSYDLYDYINFVEVKDNIVYAAYVTENMTPYMSVRAFDISNPYNPRYIGYNEYRSSVAHYQAKRADLLVETNDDGILVYKKDGATYKNAGNYNLGDHAYAVALKGDYIFVANGRDGLRVLKGDLGGYSGRFIK